MRESAGESQQATIDYFDRVRKKRHRAVYDEAGIVSDREARYLLRKAEGFIEWVETKLVE